MQLEPKLCPIGITLRIWRAIQLNIFVLMEKQIRNVRTVSSWLLLYYSVIRSNVQISHFHENYVHTQHHSFFEFKLNSQSVCNFYFTAQVMGNRRNNGRRSRKEGMHRLQAATWVMITLVIKRSLLRLVMSSSGLNFKDKSICVQSCCRDALLTDSDIFKQTTLFPVRNGNVHDTYTAGYVYDSTTCNNVKLSGKLLDLILKQFKDQGREDDRVKPEISAHGRWFGLNDGKHTLVPVRKNVQEVSQGKRRCGW